MLFICKTIEVTNVLNFSVNCKISDHLTGLFHPACLAYVVSWFAFVVAIFMAHENGKKQRPTKRRFVDKGQQGKLDETDCLNSTLIILLEIFQALGWPHTCLQLFYSMS